MAVSELSENVLRLAARRAYERGRWNGALWRGAVAVAFALPSFAICNQTVWAAVCLAGFGVVVTAGRARGEGYEDGSRAGALAGILPCLLPAAIRLFDPQLCVLLSSQGAWLCGIGGAAAGVILGLRGRTTRGLPFWSSALLALGFAASLGCIPAGAIGFAGLAMGVIVGGAPVLVSRKALTG